MAEALQAAPPDTQAVGENSIISALLEVADQAGQNPFDVHEHVNSLLAGFPVEASVMLLLALVAGKKPVIDQAVVGFVLHADAVLAQSVAEALAASATKSPVESSLIERLVRIRPWLPQTRHARLDATMRAMRLNALPPVKTELPKVIKCYVSVCDGSGTRSLFVTQRVGAHYQIASVMMKLAGVVDAMVLPELYPDSARSEDPLTNRRDLDSTERMIRPGFLDIELRQNRSVGLGRVGRSSSGPTCECAGVARRWMSCEAIAKPVAGRRHHPHLVSPV